MYIVQRWSRIQVNPGRSSDHSPIWGGCGQRGSIWAADWCNCRPRLVAVASPGRRRRWRPRRCSQHSPPPPCRTPQQYNTGDARHTRLATPQAARPTEQTTGRWRRHAWPGTGTVSKASPIGERCTTELKTWGVSQTVMPRSARLNGPLRLAGGVTGPAWL